MMRLQQALGWLPGVRLVGDASVQALRVNTDTRSLQAGDLFVALKGERFDAHEFLAQAKAQGAVAAIAHHGLAEAGLPGLEVPDTRLALGRLAAGWRSQFKLPLVAVAGSNGKTTVTQMIAAILRAWKADKAFATEGNLNNDIGVPLTLLRLTAAHEVGVVELGMNHPGEIAYLAELSRPTVALVNNAQREHLEFMATVEAVARENGSVFQSLDAAGTAVFPADDDYTPLWRELVGARKVLTFALSGAPPPRKGWVAAGRWPRPRQQATSIFRCTSPAATTSRMPWPPRPARWRRVCPRPLSPPASRPLYRSRAVHAPSPWRCRAGC
jgi:UDP-N-acetylmuramoyl-tripeptide--D-alanyl-D-alanine ligase